MKRVEFGYTEDWKMSPMAYWVHIESDSKDWYESELFSPPAPAKVGDLGYQLLSIEFDGHTFHFTSSSQFTEFKNVMRQKLLPTSLSLSSKRKGRMGPNSHWLSRLPAKTKSWKFREKLIKYCDKIEF